MLLPFGIKRRNIRLWHSTVPFSKEEYGWVKYTFVFPFSTSERSANSEPLSAVIVLNTELYCSEKYASIFWSALLMVSAVWWCALIQRDIRVIRSVITKAQGSFSSFLPIIVSNSQWPNSSLFSTLSGRSSILLPRLLRFSLTFFAFVFLRNFSGKSKFVNGSKPRST